MTNGNGLYRYRALVPTRGPSRPATTGLRSTRPSRPPRPAGNNQSIERDPSATLQQERIDVDGSNAPSHIHDQLRKPKQSFHECALVIPGLAAVAVDQPRYTRARDQVFGRA